MAWKNAGAYFELEPEFFTQKPDCTDKDIKVSFQEYTSVTVQ